MMPTSRGSKFKRILSQACPDRASAFAQKESTADIGALRAEITRSLPIGEIGRRLGGYSLLGKVRTIHVARGCQ